MLSPQHILIIDDDLSIVMYMRHILRKEKHIVYYFSSYEPNVDFSRYDIAFVDLILPDTDGLTAIQDIMIKNPCIKIIAMSGGNICPPSTYLPTALKCGAICSLSKPFSKSDILNCIAKVTA